MINILEKIKNPYPTYTTSSGEVLILDEKTIYYTLGNSVCRYVLGKKNHRFFYKCTGLKRNDYWDTSYSSFYDTDNLNTFTKEDIHNLNG